jgi:hypothetical protein
VWYVYKTDNLAVDADGVLWARMLEIPDVELGPIEDEPDVPVPMVAERAELLELWQGPTREDERNEWRSTFRRQSGI